MKKSIFLLAIIFIVLGCKKEESNERFKYFEFSFDNSSKTSFSIQLIPNDSIYLREYLIGYLNSEILIREKNYIATISKEDRKQLYSLISKIQVEKYDSIYNSNLKDGRSYHFYIIQDSIKKSIYIHSDKSNVPKELDSLGNWIYKWRKKTKLIKTNKNLIFKTSKYLLPPPPPLKIE